LLIAQTVFWFPSVNQSLVIAQDGFINSLQPCGVATIDFIAFPDRW